MDQNAREQKERQTRERKTRPESVGRGERDSVVVAGRSAGGSVQFRCVASSSRHDLDE